MNFVQWWDKAFAERLVITFAHFLWQGACVAVLTFIASLILARASSTVRYSFFSLALLVLGLCPALTFLSVDHRPRAMTELDGALLNVGEIPIDNPTSISKTVAPAVASENARPHKVTHGTVVASPLPSEEALRLIVPYASWLYLSGVIILLGRLALSLHGGWRLRALSQPVTDAAWLVMISRQASALKLKCAPAVAFCQEVAVPTVVGVVRPTILLPLSLASGLSLEQVEAVLTHELAHVRRCDHLINILQRIIEALLFFHPAVWWVSHHVRIEREHCCDDLVLRIGTKPQVYLASLLDVAELGLSPRHAASLRAVSSLQATGGNASQLAIRVQRLLGAGTCRPVRLTRGGFLSFVTVMLLMALAVIVSRSSVAGNERLEAAKGALVYKCLVVDKETGEPVSGAVVTVRRMLQLSGNMGMRLFAKTEHTTNEVGQYEFIIPPQQVAQKSLLFEVEVRHEDYAAIGGIFDSPGALLKHKRLGNHPWFERVELFPGEEVEGTILSPDGEPLMGVDVFGFSAAKNNGPPHWVSTHTVTDADGIFQFVFHKDGEAAIWVAPKDYAVIEKYLAFQRGDLGEIHLSPGVRLTGQVLDLAGRPVPRVYVSLLFDGERDLGQLPIESHTQRSALTDSEGRFVLDPVPAGEFRAIVGSFPESPLSKELLSRDFTRHPVPAVFLPKSIRVTKPKGTVVESIRAAPDVVVRAQNLDHHEQKTRGQGLAIRGTINGNPWNARAFPDQKGAIALSVPHGLNEVVVGFFKGDNGAVRYRRGKGQPLQDGAFMIQLGTLLDDVEDLEVVRYQAPIVFFAALDETQQQIPDLAIKAKYAKPQPGSYRTYEGTDIKLTRQTDGRYRTLYMLPDEDVTFTITADGYSSVEEKVNLQEGETKEMVVTLKKITDATTK